MKNFMTPAGIEPRTFRFVAQHLNHRATPVPQQRWMQGHKIPHARIADKHVRYEPHTEVNV
jgi:hypothetical protein